MIRIVAFLLLVAAVACSSTREISVRASAIQEHATAITDLAEQIRDTSHEVESIRTAEEIRSRSMQIRQSVTDIHAALPGVADVVPWWATLIRYALVAAAIAGLCVLVWQTGIGVALRAAVGLIPQRVRSEAEMAAATLDPTKPESVREWVAMRRALDPLFDSSFQAAKEKKA